MNEFIELEKRCKKLKRKTLLKNLFLALIVIIVLSGGYFLFNVLSNYDESKASHHSKHNISNPKKQIENNKSNKIVIHKEVIKKTQEKTQIIPKKHLSKVIIKKEENSTPKVIVKENITQCKVIIETKDIVEPTLKLDINFSNIDNNVDKPQSKEIKKKTQQQKQKKVVTTSTQTKTKKSIIQDETITFDKAYILAKSYYDSEDYVTSMKWCKIAAQLNNSDERVWELYALNLENTNQKEKAIQVLKTYLKYKDSLRLKYLLQRLEQ